MSKIKNSLDENVDLTDPRDISCLLDDEMPDKVDFAVNKLISSINELTDSGPNYFTNYDDEIAEASLKLRAFSGLVHIKTRRSF